MKLRLSTITALAVAGIAGFLLFQTSQNVQQAEDKLRVTHEKLAKEEDAMRVLETEWDYLNRPDRIEDLARQHLKMQPPTPNALVKDSQSITNPPPAPEKKAIPAVARIAPPARTTNAPMAPSVSDNEHKQFDDLMKDLATQNPAAGGGQ
jgi:cell division protein FtsL